MVIPQPASYQIPTVTPHYPNVLVAFSLTVHLKPNSSCATVRSLPANMVAFEEIAPVQPDTAPPTPRNARHPSMWQTGSLFYYCPTPTLCSKSGWGNKNNDCGTGQYNKGQIERPLRNKKNNLHHMPQLVLN